MKESPLKEESYKFAIRIVRLVQYLQKEKRNSSSVIKSLEAAQTLTQWFVKPSLANQEPISQVS